MSNLEFQRHYTIDLTGQLKVGNIPSKRLYTRMQDGRILGLLVEDIVVHSFNDMIMSESNGAPIDFFKIDAVSIKDLQSKTFKSSCVSLTPSKMKGAGRKFDLKEFMAYTSKIDGWVFTHTSDFPLLHIYTLETPLVMSAWKITRSDAKISLDDIKRLTISAVSSSESVKKLGIVYRFISSQ